MSKNEIQKILSIHPNKKSFFIVDLETITTLYRKFKELLPQITPYYAVKCNPNPTILKYLNSLQTNFDCASQKEIKTVLSITNDPNRIIYANPCKSPDDIKYSAQNNINLMTFDCIEELKKIHQYHPTSQLLLRLAVDDSKSLISFNSKFGAISNNIPELIQTAIQYNLTIVGFSFHVGSCCKDPSTYYRALQSCKEATEIAQEYGITISIIDIGGGFTIDKIEDEAHHINFGIKDFFPNNNVKIIAEPGRYFVETTHTLVVNVIGKKQIENKFIYTINESVYQSFNNIIFDYFTPRFLIVDEKVGPQYNTTIFGQTCDSIDKIADGIMLPELEVGDWLYINNMGAYSYAAASEFNGFYVGECYYI